MFQPAEDSCANIFGLDLPADTALAASNRITSLARAVKQAGDPRSLDQLRADIFLNLLLGNPSPAATKPCLNLSTTDLSTYDSADRSAGTPAGCLARTPPAGSARTLAGSASSARTSAGSAGTPAAGSAGAGAGGSAGTAAGGSAGAGAGGSAGTAAGGSVGAPGGGVVGGVGPVGRAGGVELVASLQTLAGLAEQPGHLNGYGPVIADIARQVAAQQRDTPWTFTIHDESTGDIHTGALRTRPRPRLRQARTTRKQASRQHRPRARLHSTGRRRGGR